MALLFLMEWIELNGKHPLYFLQGFFYFCPMKSHNEKWHYSLVDIVAVLSESKNPTDYLKKIRQRNDELKTYIGTNCPYVGMQTSSGKNRKTLAGNTKDVFRLIQSSTKE
jgi:hypothetical protein